jgi:hypothetical protein
LATGRLALGDIHPLVPWSIGSTGIFWRGTDHLVAGENPVLASQASRYMIGRRRAVT